MLPRFNHILIPVDVIGKNRNAIDIAFELAIENKANVSMLHVIQEIENAEERVDDETNEFYENVKSHVLSEMERLSQQLIESGVDVGIKAIVGDRKQTIVTYASDHNVDLIVMSSHTVDPENIANSLNTLSYKVSVMCDCPILLLK